jgi:hypothetical protein
MKITETTLSLGRTVNLGNYESLRADLSIRVELDGDSNENFDAVVAEMKRVLSGNLERVLDTQLNNTEEFL